LSPASAGSLFGSVSGVASSASGALDALAL